MLTYIPNMWNTYVLIVKVVILAFFIFSVKPLEAARLLDVMKSKLAAIKVSIPQKRAQVPPSFPNPLCIYIYIYVVKAWLHLLDLSKNCYNIGTRLCDNWQLITISFREFYENLKSRDTFCLYTKYPPAICKKACTPFFFEHANIIGSWYEVMW